MEPKPIWVQEDIDLTAWLDLYDDSVSFQSPSRLVADEFIESDGFYFDDFELNIIYKGFFSGTLKFDPAKFRLTSRPNPASDYVVIDLKGVA